MSTKFVRLVIPAICLLFLSIQSTYAQSTVPGWNGFFAGINLGYGSAKIDGTVLEDLTDPNNVYPYYNPIGNATASGFAGGLQFGLDHQIGHWVVGGQISLDGADMSGGYIYLGGTSPYNRDEDRIQSLYTITGRLGYLIQPTRLVYLRAGGVQTKTKHTDNDPTFYPNDVGGTGYYGTTNLTRNGWLLGLGFEQKIAGKISLFGEYDYMDFGSQNATIWYSDGGVYSFSFKQKLSYLTLGINYRFF